MLARYSIRAKITIVVCFCDRHVDDGRDWP